MRNFLKWCKEAGVKLKVSGVEKVAAVEDDIVWKPEIRLIEHTIKKQKSFWVLLPQDIDEAFKKMHATKFCPPAYTVYTTTDGIQQPYRVYTISLDHGGASYKFTVQPLSCMEHNSGFNTQVFLSLSLLCFFMPNAGAGFGANKQRQI